MAVLEDRIDAELALGEHARLVGELEALVREHPLRERLVGQLMLALYRSGRQADALETTGERASGHELGLEPGPHSENSSSRSCARTSRSHSRACAAGRTVEPFSAGRAVAGADSATGTERDRT